MEKQSRSPVRMSSWSEDDKSQSVEQLEETMEQEEKQISQLDTKR